MSDETTFSILVEHLQHVGSSMSDETTLSILVAAREKISTPAQWTKEVMARRSDGTSTGAYREGVCFCAFGAVDAVLDEMFRRGIFTDRRNESIAILNRLAAKRLRDKGAIYSSMPIFVYNDTHEHYEVLDLFDEAIASLKAD